MWLLIEGSFWVSDRDICPLFLSALGPYLGQTCVCSTDDTIVSMSPEGRNLMATSLLGLNVLRSLTLCILSGVGLCICSLLLQEEASLWMTEQD